MGVKMLPGEQEGRECFPGRLIAPASKPSASTSAKTDDRGNSSKNETWLGDLDSNQDCSGQSREFYR